VSVDFAGDAEHVPAADVFLTGTELPTGVDLDRHPPPGGLSLRRARGKTCAPENVYTGAIGDRFSRDAAV
jgi:hypothetical protein